MNRKLLALVVLAAAVSGCAVNPVTGKPDFMVVSEAQELAIGAQNYAPMQQAEGGVYDIDPELTAYVRDVGNKLAAVSDRPLPYEFVVLNNSVPNAWALPGGKIAINRGLLTELNSEAELAAVLGHEVGHVTARHAVRQQTGATAAGVGATLVAILTGSGDLANLANLAGTALVRGYGRDMELEADAIGAEYLDRLGFDPEAMIDVVRLLKNQETLEVQIARQEGREPRVYHGVFSTHPDNDTRLKEVVASARRAGTTEARPDGRDAYLKHIEGLPLGHLELGNVGVDGDDLQHIAVVVQQGGEGGVGIHGRAVLDGVGDFV